jgi:predicted helicase
MSKNSKTFSQYFAQYRDTIQTKLRSGDATELSYYGSLERLIEEIKPNLAVTSSAKGSQSTGINNKVDFTIKDKKSGVPKGHIEAKDIGISLNAIENSEQLQRYRRDFTNLILTDFIEFRWYVKGSLRKTIKIGSVSGNKLKINPNAEEEFQSFFEDFLNDNVTLITSPEDLALKLADKTKDIREKVKEELKNHVEDDSGPLDEMMEEFQKVLLKDLDGEKFSDMLAQTLTYGLFAARVHHHNSDSKNEFSRLTAGQILPPTYQFLRKFLQEFVNERLPDSLLELTDDVISILLNTDIKTIMEALAKQGKEDAIIYFYENFLSAYDEDIRKQLGVYYTPNPVVDYMVRSIDEILQTKFGRKKGLADEKTLILDPALGTGSYLKKVIEEIKKKIPDNKWNDYVSDSLLNRIFGFEVLMAPYTIAHLKLGLQLESTGYKFKKDKGLGVYLTNTLEETAHKSEEVSLKFLKDEASGAFKIKRTQPIMVVIGNPPYSVTSQNDGNWIRKLMRGTDTISNKATHNYFECQGAPLAERNANSLNDDYVKFMRFAQWRIEQTGHGIMAFITNNGYLDNPTFRGMRESLIRPLALLNS